MILLHRLRATDFKQMERLDVRFPDNGTVLIEGRNEAGKSTLFEAIFFALYGILPGDTSPRDARRYGTETMEVILDFSIEGRAFCVSRRQGKNQTASLTFSGVDGENERTSGLSAVNKQIAEELNLSAQGLLNTCFVEQKKLEHLESLNPAQRQTAINGLVNLSAFDRILKDFPAEADEKRRESAAKVRLTIARLDTAFTGLEETLVRLRPLHAAAQLGAIGAAQEACTVRSRDLAMRKEALERVLTLQEHRSWLLQTVRPALSLWEAAEETEITARRALSEAQEAEKRFPDLKSDVVRLTGLEALLTIHQQFHAEEARLKQWETSQQTIRAEVARLTDALTLARTRWDEAQAALLAAEKHDALLQWAGAKDELDAALFPAPDPKLAALTAVVQAAKTDCETAKRRAEDAEMAAQKAERDSRDTASRNREEIRRLQSDNPSESASSASPDAGSGIGIGIGVGLVVLGLLCVVAAIAAGWWILLLPAALLLGGGAVVVRQKQADTAARQREQAQLEERARSARKALDTEIARRNAASDTALDTAQSARVSATALAKAHSDTLVVFADAERQLAEYRIGSDPAALLPGLRLAFERTDAALRTLRIEPLPETSDAAKTQAGNTPRDSVTNLRQNAKAAQTIHGDAQDALRRAESCIVRHQPLCVFDEAQRASIRTAPQKLREAGFALDGEQLKGAIKEAGDSVTEATRLVRQLPTLVDTWNRAVPAVQERKGAFKNTLKCTDSNELFPKLHTELGNETVNSADRFMERMLADLQERESAEDRALTALSRDDLRKQVEEISRSEGAVREEMDGLRMEEAAPRRTLELAPGDVAPLSDVLPVLRCTYPEAFHEAVESWHRQIEATQINAQNNRAERRAHAETAQILDPVLDEATERAVYEDCLFSRGVNTEAKRILGRTREAILSRVMPGTLQITRRILPLLTENRYRDVQWDMSNNLIEVMDTRKGDWAVKKVFSGGTRDQISLALRLSFVLATLPGSKSTRPGWLFLDEPLSSFDAARSESLIKLLTTGNLIRPRFPQIFLISHGTAADPARFDYHLIMDSGSISPLSRMPPV